MKTAVVALALSAVGVFSAHSETVYSSEAGTPNNQATTHYMEIVTVGQAGTNYTLNSLEVEVRWNNVSNGNQNIYAFLSSDVNPASNIGIMGSGNYIAYGAFQARPTLTGENDFYTLDLNAFFTNSLVVNGSQLIGVELVLARPGQADQYAPSNSLTGNFDGNSSPTVGTNPSGKVYTSTDNNSDFTSSNITTFPPYTSQSIRFALVPEPSTFVFSAMAGCVMLGAVIRRRGNRSVF